MYKPGDRVTGVVTHKAATVVSASDEYDVVKVIYDDGTSGAEQAHMFQAVDKTGQGATNDGPNPEIAETLLIIAEELAAYNRWISVKHEVEPESGWTYAAADAANRARQEVRERVAKRVATRVAV